MDVLRKYTCVSFDNRRNEPDFVRIAPVQGCAASVGKRSGRNDIYLDRKLEHFLGIFTQNKIIQQAKLRVRSKASRQISKFDVFAAKLRFPQPFFATKLGCLYHKQNKQGLSVFF
jgi:hypothetical protein